MGDQAEQVVERRPGMPPAVPPEGEFVEIALEVLFARAMERAGEPALQIGEHPMHPGQQDVCRHAAFRLARMPVFPELHVAGQTVAATPAIGLAGIGVQIDPETGPKRPLYAGAAISRRRQLLRKPRKPRIFPRARPRDTQNLASTDGYVTP